MTDRHDPNATKPEGAERPRVALALQGGGAHGAYGWGVVERLLEEDIEIVGVSGASACSTSVPTVISTPRRLAARMNGSAR